MCPALKKDRLATTAEIAKSYGISKSRLMKVAHELAGSARHQTGDVL